MTNFIKHAPKGFYLLFLNWSWLSTPLSAPPARKYILPLKFLWMEERGADLTPGLCCRAASHSSQPCSPVLAASLTRIISSRTCPALHRPLLLPALLLLPHGLWNPELGAAGRLQVMGSSASAEITDWEEGTSSIHLPDILSTDLDLSFSSSYSDLFSETEDPYG